MKKISLWILLCMAVLLSFCGLSVAEGGTPAWTMPEELILGDFLPIGIDPVDGAVAYEATFTLTNPERLIHTERIESPQALIPSSDFLYEGAYQVSLSAELEDGSILQRGARPLTIRSVGSSYGFVMFADCTETSVGEPVTISYRKYQMNEYYYPREVTILSSDGQSLKVSDPVGTVSWVFNAPGDYDIGLYEVNTTNPAYTANLPVHIHVTAEYDGVLDMPVVSLIGAATITDGAVISYVPCANAEAAGIQVNYTLNLTAENDDSVIYTTSQTGGSSFSIPGSVFSVTGLYNAAITAEAETGNWLPGTGGCGFFVTDKTPLLQINGYAGSADAEVEVGQPFAFDLTTNVTSGAPFLYIESRDYREEPYSERLELDPALLAEGHIPVSYQFPEPGFYWAWWTVEREDSETGDLITDSSAPLFVFVYDPDDEPLFPLRYSWSFLPDGKALVVTLEDADPRMDWCRATVTRPSDGWELSAGRLFQNQLFLPLDNLYGVCALDLQISYGRESGPAETVGEIIPLFMGHHLFSEDADENPFNFGLSEYGVIYVSKTEVAVNEGVEIFIWMNNAWLEAFIGEDRISSYTHPEYFDSSTHNILFHAENYTFSEPGKYRIYGAANPLRGGATVTDIIEVTVTGVTALETPVTEPVVSFPSGQDALIPILYADPQTACFDTEVYTFSSSDDSSVLLYEHTFEANESIVIPADVLENGNIYDLKVTARTGDVLSEQAQLYLFMYDSPDPGEDDITLRINGAADAAVNPGESFEISFDPFTLQTDLYDACVLEIWSFSGETDTIVKEVNPESGLFSCNLETEGFYQCDLRLWGPEDYPETDRLLGSVYVLVREDPFILGIPQAIFPVSVHRGDYLPVEVLPLSNADWYEVDVFEVYNSITHAYGDETYFHARLDEPGTVLIPTYGLIAQHNYRDFNNDFWICIKAGNDAHQVISENILDQNLVTVLVDGNRIPVSVSTTEIAANEPFSVTVGLHDLWDYGSEEGPVASHVGIYVDGMLQEDVTAPESDPYVFEDIRINSVGNHWIGAVVWYGTEHPEAYYSRQIPITITGDSVLEAPQISVPEVSGFELPLTISPVENAESYLVNVFSLELPQPSLSFSLASAGEHLLDLTGLQWNHTCQISVCAQAEGYASTESWAQFILGSASLSHPLLTYNGSAEEAEIPVGQSATFVLAAPDANSMGYDNPVFVLDGVENTTISLEYTGSGYSITYDLLSPGPHQLSAYLRNYNMGNFSFANPVTLRSNVLHFTVISQGPVPMPTLQVPDEIYAGTFVPISIGESDVPGLKVTVALYNSNNQCVEQENAPSVPCNLQFYADPYGSGDDNQCRMEITASAPGYEDTTVALPVQMLPVETPGITLLLKSLQVAPSEALRYIAHGVDCTLTALHINNVNSPSTSGNRTISLSGTHVYSSETLYGEGVYEVYAEGTLENGETVESEHYTVTVAYYGTLDYPEIRISAGYGYLGSFWNFSFSPVENATSYRWYARPASNGGSGSTSGVAYPEISNSIYLNPSNFSRTGRWYLEVVPSAVGWRSPSTYTTRYSFTIYEAGPDMNIRLMLGDEPATEYTFLYRDDFYVPITADAPGAYALHTLFNGYTGYTKDGDHIEDYFWVEDPGDYLVFAQAIYTPPDESGSSSSPVWETTSAPVTVHIICYGTLTSPALTVPEEVVRGDLLRINIDPVENAAQYTITILPEDNIGNGSYYGVFDHAGTVEIPTGQLTAGGEYSIECTCSAEGWRSSVPGEASFRVTEPEDQAPRLAADKTEVLTMKEYILSAYAPGADALRIFENGEMVETNEEEGGMRDTIIAYGQKSVPGIYTYQVSVRNAAGEWSEPSGDVQVTVTAPYGTMAGEFSFEVPSTFCLDDPLPINLHPIPGIHEYWVEIFAAGSSSGQPVHYDITDTAFPDLYYLNLTAGETYRIDILPYVPGYEGPRKSCYTVPTLAPEGEITLTLNGSEEDLSVSLDETVTVRVEAPDASGIVLCRNGVETHIVGSVLEEQWTCSEEGTEYIYAWYTADDIEEEPSDWNALSLDGISKTLKLTVTALGTLEPVEAEVPEKLVQGVPLNVILAESEPVALYTVSVFSTDESDPQCYGSVSGESAGTYTLPTDELEPGQDYRVTVTLSAPGWLPVTWNAGEFSLLHRLDPPQFTVPEVLLTGDLLRIQINPVPNAISYTLRIFDRNETVVYSETKSRAGVTLIDSTDYQDFLSTGRYTVVVECKADPDGLSTSSSSQVLTVLGAEWTTLRLPAGLKEIEEEAFAGISANIVSVSEGITSIGDRAFAGSTALCVVIIPDSVTGISPTAFADCPNVAILCSPDSPAAAYAAEQNIPLF